MAKYIHFITDHGPEYELYTIKIKSNGDIEFKNGSNGWYYGDMALSLIESIHKKDSILVDDIDEMIPPENISKIIDYYTTRMLCKQI